MWRSHWTHGLGYCLLPDACWIVCFFPRVYSSIWEAIPIKQNGNVFEDVKLFEENLDIEIQIYNFESRQIYKGSENQIKIYILMSESHFDVISNIACFTCFNDDHHKSEYKKM